MNPEEYYRLRAEDFGRNFESLRSVEWRIAFQAYAGYAATALAYASLRSSDPKSKLIAWGAIFATLILAIVTVYLSLRVQERLHNTRRLQNRCYAQLERLAFPPPATADLWPAAHAVPPRNWFRVHDPPIHARWYAFGAQTVISVSLAMGIILYVFITT